MVTNSTETAREKLNLIRKRQKVFGVPKLPQKIEAMYQGHRPQGYSGYRHYDSAMADPVYTKLNAMLGASHRLGDSSAIERVASHLMNSMESREMNEKTYKHLSRMPAWLLKLEFLWKHEKDAGLRGRIEDERRYMFS